jgi:hypothetical protein
MLMKRGIKKICDGSYIKHKKTDHHLLKCSVGKENTEIKNESENKKGPKTASYFQERRLGWWRMPVPSLFTAVSSLVWG